LDVPAGGTAAGEPAPFGTEFAPGVGAGERVLFDPGRTFPIGRLGLMLLMIPPGRVGVCGGGRIAPGYIGTPQ